MTENYATYPSDDASASPLATPAEIAARLGVGAYPGFDHGSDGYSVFAPPLPAEITTDSDLTGLIMTSLHPQPGDIIAISSKVISKREGRVVQLPTDPAAQRAAKEALIDAHTVREVARIHSTRIVESTLGITHAAAGIDASNTDPATVVLLPQDPDASAHQLRTQLQQALGITTGPGIGVLLCDTVSRAWRRGQVDIAIGAAGVRTFFGYAGATDVQGNPLAVTDICVADELAAAANLAGGKLSGRPWVRLRGLSHLVDEAMTPGSTTAARSINRTGTEDLFYLGTAEALAAGARAQAAQADPTEQGPGN